MNRAALHEGLRRMRFESVLDRQERGEITQADAAEMLGIHERTFRRWRDRFTEEGEPGLADRRLGKPSSHRAAALRDRLFFVFKNRWLDQSSYSLLKILTLHECLFGPSAVTESTSSANRASG